MTVTEQDLADIQARLLTFMDQHIYPNEQRYHDQLNGLADRFSTVPLMEELKGAGQSRWVMEPLDAGGSWRLDERAV